MQIFENFDSNCFKYNGLKYVKNFIVMPAGPSAVAVYNAFDTRLQLMPATHYSQVQINDANFGSQQILMDALTPLVFSKQVVSEGEFKDEILYIGDISQDGNELTIPALAVWRIGGITLSNEDDFVTTVSSASTGSTRIDIIVAKADSTFELIQGEPSDDVAVAPVVPNNTLLVTSITILGQYIILGGDTPVGNIYVRKDDTNETFVGAYGDLIELAIEARRGVLRFIGGCPTLGSLALSNLTGLFNGKRLIIKNFQSIPLTILHNGGTGIYKFYFPNEEDFVLQPNQIIDFTYSATIKKFEYIGAGSSSASDLQSVLTAGNYAELGFTLLVEDRTIQAAAYGLGVFFDGKSGYLQESSIGLNNQNTLKYYGIGNDDTGFFIRFRNGETDGSIFETYEEITGDSSEDVTLIKPYENGTYATREWVSANTATDKFVTGATYNATSKVLSINSNLGPSVTASGWTDTDTIVTGGTYSQSGKTLTLASNAGTSVVITGITEVVQTITSGVTTTSPSQAVLYNALAAKAPRKSYIVATTGNTLGSGTALRPIFTTPTNGAITVEANSLYSFECNLSFTGSSSSNIVQFGINGTATITSIGYNSIFSRGTSYLNASQFSSFNNVTTAANLHSSSTGAFNNGLIKGTFTTGSAGTIIPSIGFSISAVATIEAGSMFSIERLGDNINLYSPDAS